MLAAAAADPAAVLLPGGTVLLRFKKIRGERHSSFLLLCRFCMQCPGFYHTYTRRERTRSSIHTPWYAVLASVLQKLDDAFPFERRPDPTHDPDCCA